VGGGREMRERTTHSSCEIKTLHLGFTGGHVYKVTIGWNEVEQQRDSRVWEEEISKGLIRCVCLWFTLPLPY